MGEGFTPPLRSIYPPPAVAVGATKNADRIERPACMDSRAPIDQRDRIIQNYIPLVKRKRTSGDSRGFCG